MTSSVPAGLRAGGSWTAERLVPGGGAAGSPRVAANDFPGHHAPGRLSRARHPVISARSFLADPTDAGLGIGPPGPSLSAGLLLLKGFLAHLRRPSGKNWGLLGHHRRDLPRSGRSIVDSFGYGAFPQHHLDIG